MTRTRTRRLAPARRASTLIVALATLLTGCTGMATRDETAARGPAPVQATVAQPAVTITPNDGLITALRDGGYVLVIQHGAAEQQPDRDGPALNNCEAQANLTEVGVADARALGLGVRRMGIPVGPVLASPYCRARDTARLGFGRVEVAFSLAPPPATPGRRRATAAREFRELLGTAPPEGANTVLVTHPATVAAVLATELTAGEALVYDPQPDGSARLVRRIHVADLLGLARAKPVTEPALARGVSLREYPLPPGTAPYAVALYPHTGIVWFTAQGSGALGRLDPRTGQSRLLPLGPGSAPRGLAVGPDGALWVADSGQNAILRVEPTSGEVRRFPLPATAIRADLATVRFGADGTLWFTGRSEIVGSLDIGSGQITTFDVPDDATPDGLVVTGDGEVYYASPADGHAARVDRARGTVEVLRPPTPGQGIRQAAANEPGGRVWFTESAAGQLASLTVETGAWSEWRLPGQAPEPGGLYVDRGGQVWVTDLAANALLRFDPVSERFAVLDLPTPDAQVRTLTGSGSNELWGAASGADRLLRVQVHPARTGSTTAAPH